MPQVRSWWWILAAVPAILILRIAGFIGSFWTGLGVVALLAFLALLEMFPVTVRRYVFVFFIGWVILFLGLPALRTAFLAPRPLLREALERRGIATDLQASELADPVALRAKLGWKRYCVALEEERGKWVRQELDKLLAQTQPTGPGGLPSPDRGREEQLRAALRQVEKDREECKRLLLPSVPSVPQEVVGLPRLARPADITDWLWVIGIGFGLLIILGAFIPALRGTIWPLAILVAILVAIGWYASGGKLPQISAQPVPPAAQPVEEFSCSKGQEILTGLVGPGTFHRIQANHPWTAVVRADGAEYPMPAGFSSWKGGTPEGLLRVRCLHDGTVIRFQKVR